MNLSNDIVIHKKVNNQEFLQFKRLLKYPNICHAYSIGLDKNYRTFKANREALSKADYEKNMRDYKILCEVNNLNDKNIIKANQNHTDTILKIQKVKNERNGIDTEEISDGIITDKKDVVLATTNADCILLLFYDPIKNVIANTHSGWKGTLQEISVKTVKKMQEEYECNPKDIIVCICPSIRSCHFEVDKDVYNLFYDKFKSLKDVDKFLSKNGDKWNIDTVLINKIILMQSGILEENIEDCGICSMCNKDYIHSFRAEGQSYGLSTALISLK